MCVDSVPLQDELSDETHELDGAPETGAKLEGFWTTKQMQRKTHFTMLLGMLRMRIMWLVKRKRKRERKRAMKMMILMKMMLLPICM